MGPHDLGLLSLTAVTCAGWATALAATYGLDRWRLRLRSRRLDAVGGVREGRDRARLADGTEVRLQLLHDHRVVLRVRAEVPGLPEGSRLWCDPGIDCPPVVGLLHLALTREGLLGLGYDLTAGPGWVEVAQWGRGLPGEGRIEGLVGRVRRATQTCLQALDGGTLTEIAVKSLLDPDPWVRLSAARVSGTLGRTVLARLAADRRLDVDVRIEAARALVARSAPDEAVPVLARCARGPARLARYAVRALAEHDDAAERLAELLGKGHVDPAAAPLAVERLAREPERERLLLRALPAVGTEAKRAILHHLERFGGPRAHAALDRHLSRGGFGIRLDGLLRRAVRATRDRADAGRGALSRLEAGPAPRGALSPPAVD